MQLISREEFAESAILKSRDGDRFRFNDGQVFRNSRDAPECIERINHVIQRSKEKNDVELPKCGDVHFHEVVHYSNYVAFQCFAGDVKTGFAWQRLRMPIWGLLKR